VEGIAKEHLVPATPSSTPFVADQRPEAIGLSKPRQSLNTRGVALLAITATVFMLLLNVFCRVTYEGDEGFYGVTSLNMLGSASYLLRPSYNPAGDFFADKGAFAHPPLNSYLYALLLWMSNRSLAALELFNALSFALLLCMAYRVLKWFDVEAGRFAVLLLVGSPAILAAYSQLEAEPLMTLVGLIALHCALRTGSGPGQSKWLFFCGLCMGMAFAFKLWLCGPLALAVTVALVIRARQLRASRREILPALFLLAVGAILPSALHLLAIACFYPEDLGYWMNQIYFGIFTKAGISGSKFDAATAPRDWIHPIWYYGPALYRDHFFLAPVILLGAGSLLREQRLKGKMLWILLAAIAGLLPLSLMRVKEPQYVLACAVFLYLLSGACLAALVRRISSGGDVDRFSTRLGTAGVGALFLLVLIAYALGIRPDKISGTFVIGHSIVFAVSLVLFWWSCRRRSFRLDWSIFGACALALLIGFSYQWLTRGPRDRIIAGIIRPYVQGHAPTTMSMIASNFKSYQFHTFRRGCYWEDVPMENAPEAALSTPRLAQVRAFIIDAEDLGKFPTALAPWLRWLEANTVEKTAELDRQLGSPSGFRVFVRQNGP
jgi:4-amino-4-deoxy-L-arabinose transferase-like glycosyltransferase